MFEKVKQALRISHNELNTQIQLAIDSALLELGRVGIVTTETQRDDLITSAVILYAWFFFDYRGQGQDYLTAFNSMRDALSTSGKYTTEVTPNE